MKHSGNILLLRDDEHACVQADLDRALFTLTWKGAVPSEAWRRVLIQAYMQVLQHRLRSWISDSRQLGDIPPHDEQWVMEDFTPRMVQTGLERMALVMGPGPRRRDTVDRLVVHAAPVSSFPVRIFDDMEKAIGWIAKSARSIVGGTLRPVDNDP